jgi:hypothetical protein
MFLRTLFLVLFTWSIPAAADFDCTILTWEECLDRSNLEEDLRRAGARGWELDAIGLVRSGNIGKGVVDYIDTRIDDLALGWAHFPAQSERLPIPAPRPGLCDLEHYWLSMSFLYSDAAPAIQLEAWRSVVGYSVETGRQNGCDNECAILVAAMANSSPTRAREIGHSCSWEEHCMGPMYAGSSRHRGDRVRRWRERFGT